MAENNERPQQAVLRRLWKETGTLYDRKYLDWMLGDIRREVRKQIGDFDPYAEPIPTASPGMTANSVEDDMIGLIELRRILMAGKKKEKTA
jgi:hypothetical protein